jgi:hypothetical protein
VVPGVAVEEAKQVAARRGIDDLLYPRLLTQKVHPAPNTQQAEQSWLHMRKE